MNALFAFIMNAGCLRTTLSTQAPRCAYTAGDGERTTGRMDYARTRNSVQWAARVIDTGGYYVLVVPTVTRRRQTLTCGVVIFAPIDVVQSIRRRLCRPVGPASTAAYMPKF